MQLLEISLDSIILWIAAILIGKMIYGIKKTHNVFNTIVTLLVFSFLLTILNLTSLEILSGPIKIVVVYALQCMFFKFIFQKSLSDSIIVALVWYICLFLSEAIVIIMVSITTYYNNSSMLFIKNNIIMNILIACFSLIIVNIFKNKLISLVKKESIIAKSTYIIIITVIITMALLVFKIPYNKWELDLEFLLTMLILLGFCIVGLVLIKQRAQIQETTSKYQQLANYSDVTNDLLEDYRIVAHEHKNQLLVIRSMTEAKNVELLDYIDTLLEKRGKIKYPWLGQLNHLPISGLKGLINYKLMEMENKKLNINISVSKDIMKTSLKKLSIKQKDKLYSIIGVYLDNMIQAAENSKKKEINIEIFKDKREIVFLLANSYNGKIDIDKIDDYGYTTKGKNHGIGLHIVKKIIEEENIFSQSRNILDDYYIQELRINLNEINKETAQ